MARAPSREQRAHNSFADATTPKARAIGLALMAGGAVAAAVGVYVYVRNRRNLGFGYVESRALPIDGKPVVRNGMTLTHYRAKRIPIEKRLRIIQDLTWESVKDPRNRKIALDVTRHCPERDGECEAKAVYEAIKRRIRYTGDVAPVKMGADGPVEGVDLFQSAYRTWEFGGGDCLPLSTLVLRDDYKVVPLAALNPGDHIMADGQWTVVQDRWLTDEKALLALDLSNGCVLRCTPEHRIFRVVKGQVEQIRAEEARIGDDLLVAEQIPVAGDAQVWPAPFDQLTAEERAWLLGVYIADGWYETHVREQVEKPYRIGISGRDGKPKEAQKRRVQELIQRLGLHTEWQERFVRVGHTDLASFISAAGGRAPEKHVPSLHFESKEAVVSLLDGLAADAGYEGRGNHIRVYGTTSPELAMQLRLLHRMIGQSVHIRRVDDHGGLGEHPIYRVTVREDPKRLDTRYARVRGIRDGGTEMCADLTTDRGKFWLPESDVIVHNCDDHSILAATLLSHNGVPAKFRVTAPYNSADYSHIYTLAGLPKMRPTRWVAVDSTLPGYQYGREAPHGRKRDFPA